MSKYSQAQTERERLAALAVTREDRMRAWSDARATGIREGFLMAMTAVQEGASQVGVGGTLDVTQAIKDRGDRHFGSEEWRVRK